MRRTKAATSGLVILAVLLTAGAGFAAFTSSAYINITVSSGTLGPLVWGSSPQAFAYASNDHCSVTRTTTTNPGDTLILTASGLLPGDFCTFTDTLRNLGSIPATTTGLISPASGPLCAALIYGDNFFNPSVTVGAGGETGSSTQVLSAGGLHPLPWGGTLALPYTMPSSDAGSCTFMVTLTGSAGT